jgi:trk system potassium uptake protein TrkA
MNIIIVGGGKVGYYLMKSMVEDGNEVCIIESQKSLCEKIAEEFNDMVIWGDGTSLEVLKDAGIDRADVIVAATGKDEENLAICQIAKMNYSISKTIARINNPKNTQVFKELGVDKTVCSTAVIANLISQTV